MVEETTNPEAFSPRAGSPWLLLPRAVRLAFDARKLVLAALGLILLQAGWSFLDVFLPDSKPVTSNLFETFALPRPEDPFREQLWEAWRLAPWSSHGTGVGARSNRLIALFEWGRGGRGMIHALLAVIWTIAVWGIVGGAISRLALVEVCRMRRLGAERRRAVRRQVRRRARGHAALRAAGGRDVRPGLRRVWVAVPFAGWHRWGAGRDFPVRAAGLGAGDVAHGTWAWPRPGR